MGFSATFLLEVDGVDIGWFREVSGLSVEVKVEPIAEGGQNGYVHKVPGVMEWPNLVLKRGVTGSDNLFEWFEKTAGEKFEANKKKLSRSQAAVILVDREGKRLRQWTFYDAFPVKWSGPSFSAGTSDPLVEELEVAHHGFRAS
jgi:phage tail-like protein